MAKKPNKYTRLVRYMIQTIVNDKYQAPYIDKLINGEWKEFFETVEKALQSVEEEDNTMIQHNKKETMFEKISKMIDDRFLEIGSHIAIRDENGIHLGEAIEELLENADNITDYSVDYDETFDSPGCTIYYVSMAYIEDGVLEHITYVAEER